MKRSNRLLAILASVQKRAFKLNDIVSKCNVSERTVYRDVNVLKSLGVPISNRGKGYKLSERIELNSLGVQLNEIDFVMILLGQIPTLCINDFENDISKVRLLLQEELQKHSQNDLKSRIVIDSSFSRLSDKHYNLVLIFLNSIYFCKQVSIVRKNNTSRIASLSPRRILFKKDGATLYFRTETGKRIQVDIRNLEELGLLNR